MNISKSVCGQSVRKRRCNAEMLKANNHLTPDIANPNTPYYHKLMTAMFSQSSDRHKDFTYDYHTVSIKRKRGQK